MSARATSHTGRLPTEPHRLAQPSRRMAQTYVHRHWPAASPTRRGPLFDSHRPWRLDREVTDTYSRDPFIGGDKEIREDQYNGHEFVLGRVGHAFVLVYLPQRRNCRRPL